MKNWFKSKKEKNNGQLSSTLKQQSNLITNTKHVETRTYYVKNYDYNVNKKVTYIKHYEPYTGISSYIENKPNVIVYRKTIKLNGDIIEEKPVLYNNNNLIRNNLFQNNQIYVQPDKPVVNQNIIDVSYQQPKVNEQLKTEKISSNKLVEDKENEKNEKKVEPVSLSKKDMDKLKDNIDEFEKNLNYEKIKLIESFDKEMKKNLKDKAIQYMIEAMERNAESVVSSKFSFTIKLNDDGVKGKIIGKDGRNKKTFENVTGTDLIIENDQKAVTISSPNPIRREIAKQTMEKLLDIKNIEPNKIEKIYLEVKNGFEKTCYDIGKQTLENKLKIFGINEKLFPIVGKLQFRTSYTQNVLTHSIECATLAAQIAILLNLDPLKAKKAAFFHDIGKAIDYELDNDHVECGVKIAKKYKLDDYIINAIESHHDGVAANNLYAAIVKVVDKLSAARPGARLISNEGHIKRLETIEKICKSFKGVSDAYALKSGRQIRIIVNPNYLDDQQCSILIHEIKHKLEKDELINKQPIEIILLREFVIKDKTEGTANREKQ